MTLFLEPSQALTFRRPLTLISKEILTITNDSEYAIAFKVKTTAPKLYCVRPNAGTVDVGETLEIQVMLQPFKEEPPLDEKCKDKFLVQYIPITGEMKSLEFTELWPHVESNMKTSIKQIKLRCDYADPIQVDKQNSPGESTLVSQNTAEQVESKEVTKLRLELDAYKNEVESLRCRAPDTTVVKKNGAPLPVVLVIALVSVFLAYILVR